jgi:hypothetical protein
MDDVAIIGGCGKEIDLRISSEVLIPSILGIQISTNIISNL